VAVRRRDPRLFSDDYFKQLSSVRGVTRKFPVMLCCLKIDL